MLPGDSKTCTQCGQTKPRTEFCRERKTKDGLREACMACRRAKKRLTNTADCARYRAKHRRHYQEYQRAYIAQWVRNNPEKRAEQQARAYRRKSALLVAARIAEAEKT